MIGGILPLVGREVDRFYDLASNLKGRGKIPLVYSTLRKNISECDFRFWPVGLIKCLEKHTATCSAKGLVKNSTFVLCPQKIL